MGRLKDQLYWNYRPQVTHPQIPQKTASVLKLPPHISL